MMRTLENVRGTLPVLELIQRYGFNAAIAINNVGNAFTPHGNCDPLIIAQLGVGLYQAPTKEDVQMLYVGSRFVHALHRSLADTTLQEVVSSRAKAAIGREYNSIDLEPGAPADFVLFDSMDSGWRCRKSIAEVVYDAGSTRQTVYQGRISTAKS
jgi:hypothetical protein